MTYVFTALYSERRLKLSHTPHNSINAVKAWKEYAFESVCSLKGNSAKGMRNAFSEPKKKWEKRKKKAKREPFCKQFEIFGLCFVRLTNVMERSRRRFVARDERKSETHCRERSKEIHSIMYYLRYRVGVYLWPEHRLMLADFRFISCTRKKKCKSISKRDENVRNWISFWEHRVALCNEGIFFN